MGYTTQFSGNLKFAKEATSSQLAALSKIFGQDCREHPAWQAQGLTYVDLQLTEEFDGICWNGAEKTYEMERLVNVVIRLMREQWPDFGLIGELKAQGEDFDDRWLLKIGLDGFATKVKAALTGRVVTCPHCECDFELDGT